jgi:hypothetical protein
MAAPVYLAAIFIKSAGVQLYASSQSSSTRCAITVRIANFIREFAARLILSQIANRFMAQHKGSKEEPGKEMALPWPIL